MSTATFVIRRSGGQYLMELREKPKEYEGKWLFPGGKVELDELPEEAAIREAWEEAGIIVNRWAAIKTPEPMFTITRTPFVVHAFLVISWSGEIPDRNLETGEQFGWFDAEAIRIIPTSKSVYQIIEVVEGWHES